MVNVSAEELIGYWDALDQSQRERLAPSQTVVHDWDPFLIQLDNLQYLQVCASISKPASNFGNQKKKVAGGKYAL